jgi:hypothetical protein
MASETNASGHDVKSAFSRYRRDHPHFKRHLLIDAVLSLIFGVAVFQISGYAHGNSSQYSIQLTGAVTLSADQLVAEVKRAKVVAYWLGPISGSKYSLVASRSGEAVITYLSGGEGLENPAQHNLIIETNVNSVVVGPLMGAQSAFSNSEGSTSGGAVFAYDKYVPDHSVITLPRAGGHVLIYYPTNRSPSTILLDAESLIRIS